MQLGMPLATCAEVALAGYVALGLPLGALAQRVQGPVPLDGEEAARLAFYRRTVHHHWLLIGLSLGVAGLAGWPLARLGVRLPGQSLPGSAGTTAALLVGSCAAAVAWSLWRGSRSGRTAALLPRTAGERRAFFAVAVTAAAAEELLFRGFLMLFLVDAGGRSWQQAAVISAVAFGLAHAQQGASACLAGATAGFALAECYLLTGSLLIPVLAHLAVDLLRARRPRQVSRDLEMQPLQHALEPLPVVEHVRRPG